MGVTVELNGTEIHLRNVAKRSSRAIRRAMDKGTDLIIDEARGMAPVDTKLLIDSIVAVKSDGPGRKFTEILIDSRVAGSDYDGNPRPSKKYGMNRKRPVEKYGPAMETRFGFMEEAAEVSEPIINDWIEDAIERALK